MNKPKVEDHIKTEFVEVTLTHKLRKDLQLDEEVCQDCKGLGVGIRHANYGLTVEGQKLGDGWFPFDKESIIWCNSCYNGVRKRCNHCSELVDKIWIYCQCDKSKEERGVTEYQKDAGIWNKADKILWNEATEKYGYLYIDSHDKYLSPDDLMEYIEEKINDNELELDDIENLRIYGTTESSISFDAEDIVSNGCSDLHEEAYDRIGKKELDELQSFLDNWSKSVESETTTYNSDNSVGIIFTKEDYLKSIQN